MNSNRFRESLRPLRCLLCLPVGVPQGLPIAFEMTGGGGGTAGWYSKLIYFPVYFLPS